MSKLIKYIFMIALLTSCVFAAFAFGQWETNPSQWSETARGCAAIVWFILTVLVSVGFAESNDLL